MNAYEAFAAGHKFVIHNYTIHRLTVKARFPGQVVFRTVKPTSKVSKSRYKFNRLTWFLMPMETAVEPFG